MSIAMEQTALQADQYARQRLAQFKPFAYYDKHLDCIRVQVRDCSFIEQRKNRIFTVLKANHTKEGSLVGFNIKGVRHLFEQIGLNRQACYKLADVMDAIVRFFPEATVKEIAAQLSPVIKEQNLEVRIEPEAVAA
jgi:hypothetical protein